MSDEEVDELLKGFPVQYVYILLCLSFSILLPDHYLHCPLFSFLHYISLVMERHKLMNRDGQINYHSFVRSILAQ